MSDLVLPLDNPSLARDVLSPASPSVLASELVGPSAGLSHTPSAAVNAVISRAGGEDSRSGRIAGEQNHSTLCRNMFLENCGVRGVGWDVG